jgi:ABC-type dipeptide/oligopeptide/nickel transport system ATPase component
MSERLLTVDGLSTHFFTHAGIVKAVNGVTFTLDRKETLGISASPVRARPSRRSR